MVLLMGFFEQLFILGVQTKIEQQQCLDYTQMQSPSLVCLTRLGLIVEAKTLEFGSIRFALTTWSI